MEEDLFNKTQMTTLHLRTYIKQKNSIKGVTGGKGTCIHTSEVIAGLVPDNCDKVNTTIKWVT